jgi:uncharacterized membrane protein
VFYAYLGGGSLLFGTVSYLLIFLTAFLDKVNEDNFKGSLRISAVSLITSVIVLCIMATSLYVAFTPVGSGTVNGCQYRYIVPILMLFSLFIGSGRMELKFNRKVFSIFVFANLAINILFTYGSILMNLLV